MSLKRKYDIGHGVTIEDNGYSLIAHIARSGGGMMSIGVSRPRVGPIPDQVKIIYSVGGIHYYLPDFATPHGFWLGTTKWKSEEEMKANCKPGMFGTAGHVITKDSGEVYVRERLDFAYWSVKADRAEHHVASSDDLAKDYLCIALREEAESSKRFNKEIAFTGRDLDWIMAKIGAWVNPEEIPVVVLN